MGPMQGFRGDKGNKNNKNDVQFKDKKQMNNELDSQMSVQ